MTCKMRVIIVGKTKWKPLELSVPRKNSESNPVSFPWSSYCHYQDFEDAGGVDPTSSLNFPIWPVQKTECGE